MHMDRSLLHVLLRLDAHCHRSSQILSRNLARHSSPPRYCTPPSFFSHCSNGIRTAWFIFNLGKFRLNMECPLENKNKIVRL